jgi:hypothetical protein
MRIENASRVWQECARPGRRRRFIRSLGLRMQSSTPAGESSSTQPQTQDSGTLEDAQAAQPEDAGFGETWRSIAGGAGGEYFRETWRLAADEAGGQIEPGKPRARVAGSAGRCESRGNSEIGRRCSRRSRDWGFKEAWKREELESRNLSLRHSRKTPDAGRPEEASERRA